MDKYLHIVCLDAPYPVKHGGHFDLFYKLSPLCKAGVKIILHCFENENGRSEELNKFCEQVFYYRREKGRAGFSLKLPYIVASRRNAALRERLLKDDHPILLEGVHCSYLLQDERFNGRKILLRLHNVESIYYRQLYHAAPAGFKKWYYLYESVLLKKYESFLASKAPLILAVSRKDEHIYRNAFGARHIAYLPVFTGFEEVSAKEGVGCFCLYHGNLSVPENEKTAIWLLEKVFNDIPIPFLVAGRNPSSRLARIIAKNQNAGLMANPSDEDMRDMISKAQMNVLPSFNATGVKLKLLNVLFNGRHCIVNDAAIEGTGFEPACHVAGNAEGFKSIIAQLYNRPFSEEEITLRKKLLAGVFDNEKNALRLIQWIW
ncbi:MAG: glycosyltransferase [Chitinophagaceae bacterium]|nr:glycosyltransferase [Chitinophagaceae bacterium]